MLKPVTHHEGKTLCKSGDLGIGLHIITDGRARVAIKGRTMARLEPGDFFGELALIDGGHRTADVIAESVVETLALSAWSLKTLLRKNPSVALRMLEELAKRLRSANAQLSD
jgi:CRP-like cAMP-binding protein